MTEREEDIPKTVAAIISTAPALVLRTGVAYLKTKRKIRKRTKLVMKSMIANGISRELAHRLADKYEGNFRIQNIIRTFVPNRTK